MKKSIYVIAIALLFLSACKNDKKQAESNDMHSKEMQMDTDNSQDHNHSTISMTSFGVRGNCGMCKKTIEKAANSVEGASKAVWDKEQKKIEVSFDSSKTNEMVIHEAIAASGYDTEKINGSKTAYKNLPGCCQYDHDMEMNQKGEKKNDDHH